MYRPQEREWVKRLVRLLTPDQRVRYEVECRTAPRYGHNRRLYDGEKARIAERILYNDAPKLGQHKDS